MKPLLIPLNLNRREGDAQRLRGSSVTRLGLSEALGLIPGMAKR